jgi:hypothetical protein
MKERRINKASRFSERDVVVTVLVGGARRIVRLTVKTA